MNRNRVIKKCGICAAVVPAVIAMAAMNPWKEARANTDVCAVSAVESSLETSTVTPTITPAITPSTSNTTTGTQPSGTPPTGDITTGIQPFGTPPTGETPTGTPPAGNPPTGDKPTGTPPDGAPGGNGGTEQQSASLTGAYTVDGTTKVLKNSSVSSTNADENTVLVTNEGTLTIKKGTFDKTGDSTNTDSSNFYGLNAVITANLNSKLTIIGSKITSSAEGANAIFSTGENTVVHVRNVSIATTGNSSRGLDATYGGTIIADNVDISTEGAHCAPLATDRGEGTVTVSNSTLNAKGDGSPCIYSTGNISITNVTGTATGSQAAVIEGKNSITITDSDLTGAGKNGVMLYQSTSGDAAVGTSVLNVTDSTIKTTSTGAMFYITNTDAQIILKNSELDFSSGILVEAAGNSTNNWGTPGSNGGNLTLKASNQTLKGDVTCDSISSVVMTLNKKAVYTGAVDTADTGDVSVALVKTAKWNLTADSYVTSLTDKDTKLSNINSNGYNIYYDATNTANSWLNGATYALTGGGSLQPMK